MSIIPRKNFLTKRSGSSPRLICYTQSTLPRKFNYQVPPDKTKPEIQGKFKRKIPAPPSREIIQFHSVCLKQLPNSKRTLVPSLDSESFPPKKSSRVFSPYNYTSSSSQRDFPRKKRVFCSSGSNAGDSTYNILSSQCDPFNENYRPSIKKSTFSQYKSTSQIANLPGGEKRREEEINDDQSSAVKPRINYDRPSYSMKVYKDFKSKVSCLPGSYTINATPSILENPKSYRRYRQKSDIFNIQKESDEEGERRGKFSGKKMDIDRRSNEESRETQRYFQGIRKGYHNYSQFQIY